LSCEPRSVNGQSLCWSEPRGGDSGELLNSQGVAIRVIWSTLMPRFVVLEHQWNGIHCDFMLEDGEHLRTWAIDSPELVAGKQLPARELERHRLVYLDYEGPVSGERGVVRRLDQGRYEIQFWSEDLVRVTLDGSQLVGDVELKRVASEVSIDVAPWVFRLGNFD
jgi:DNA polymerase Ligase (LigD)